MMLRPTLPLLLAACLATLTPAQNPLQNPPKSSTPPEKNKESLKLASMGIRLLSDHNHETARRYASYDVEDRELHSTPLIDASGRIRWKRTGGDPFMDIDDLLREVGRGNAPAPSRFTK